MVILSFLSLFTVQTIQSSLKAKAKIQTDLDKSSTVRDALRTIERDINHAFNYRDVSIKLYNLSQKEREKRAKNNRGNQNQGGQPGIGTSSPGQVGQSPQQPLLQNPNAPKFELKVEKIYTHFLGEKNSLDFTSLSNMRLTEDSAISTQAEIGYKLKPCRRRSTQEQSSQCLWRRVSNYIHDDITKDGEETALLENVVAFNLRYLGPGREEEWVDQWLTNERGDDQTKNKFPYAVEITLEVKDTSPGAKDKSLRMTAVASLRNPNNELAEDKSDPNASGSGQQQQQQGQGQNFNQGQGQNGNPNSGAPQPQ